MKIAVTDARRLHLDEHLAGTWRREFNRFNREWRPLFPEDGGARVHHREIESQFLSLISPISLCVFKFSPFSPCSPARS
jgi:hypothetical protein